MTENKNDVQEFAQKYKELTPADQELYKVFFHFLMFLLKK